VSDAQYGAYIGAQRSKIRGQFIRASPGDIRIRHAPVHVDHVVPDDALLRAVAVLPDQGFPVVVCLGEFLPRDEDPPGDGHELRGFLLDPGSEGYDA